MKLFKVKNNQDFIFKLVILMTAIALCFFFIYILNNLDGLFPFREGMENEDKDEEKSEESEKSEELEPEPEIHKNKTETIKYVNNAMSYENDNRANTLEKIDFYKNWLKARIIRTILYEVEESGYPHTSLGIYLPAYEFVNSSEFENILSSFPLAESVQSTSSSSESSTTSETSSMALF